VVLKRYADARKDGDQILALIRGSALNNDGPGTSFGTPNANAQERVFRQALKNSRVLASDVSYVEAHGTGTAVGGNSTHYRAAFIIFTRHKVQLIRPLFHVIFLCKRAVLKVPRIIFYKRLSSL
jgi:hypothetical protein